MKHALLAVGLFAFVVVGCRKPGHPPTTPNTPAGAAVGYIGCSYEFSVIAEDPDLDSVAVRFDWGDGDTTGWTEFGASGDTARSAHFWSSAGTFGVRAQVNDVDGEVSEWSPAGDIAISAGWRMTYGGAGADDLGYTVRALADGGFMVAGYTESYGAGDKDVWLLRCDRTGGVIWSNTYGGADCNQAFDVSQTADGGFVFVGDSAADAWIVKTDADGVVQWSRVFGGAVDYRGHSVVQTGDGGFIVAGTAYTTNQAGQVWLWKSDPGGAEEWSRTFGGVENDVGACVRQTQDGGFILVGSTSSYSVGGRDIWLIKTDAQGGTIWRKTFGGAGHDEGLCVQQDSEGGYIVAGRTNSSGAGDYDAWLLRIDAEGTEVWSRTYGGAGSDAANAVCLTEDNACVFTGGRFYSGQNDDLSLLKISADGDLIWERTFGGTEYDEGFGAQQTTDGGFAVVGVTMSYRPGDQDVWLLRTGAGGE